MTTNDILEEKRFTASRLKWDDYYEEYQTDKDVFWDGKPLQFDTYDEFVAFMASLTSDERLALGLWSLYDERTDETLMISDGIYDETNFMMLAIKREEAAKGNQ